MKRLYLSSLLWARTLSIGEWIACAIFLVSLLLAAIALPWLYRERSLRENQLLLARNTYRLAAAQPSRSTDRQKERLDRFYTMLAPSERLEQSLVQLFEVARRSGVVLDKADYRLIVDAEGKYQSYQIDLPVKANASSILTFCKQTLAALPFASLDAIRFRRDKVTNGQLEASLRLTLFMASPTSLAPRDGSANTKLPGTARRP